MRFLRWLKVRFGCPKNMTGALPSCRMGFGPLDRELGDCERCWELSGEL